MYISNIAHLMQSIDQQAQAAQQALTGLAITAPHAYINARIERIGVTLEQRKAQIGPQAAMEEAWAAMSALCDQMHGLLSTVQPVVNTNIHEGGIALCTSPTNPRNR